MTYPVWSGVNSEWVDSTEINGAAPTPTIEFGGFDSSQIPVLIGAHPGLYFEVLHTHFERKALAATNETKDMVAKSEGRGLVTLPENRDMSVERSRKAYP